jgi:hypothetical protein
MIMARKADLVISICFLLYYCYYTLMGFVFGGMSRENYYPYLFLTIVGLVLIGISLFVKAASFFSVMRIIGIVFVTALLYFDIKGSFIFETKGDIIKTIFTYFPSIVFLIFSIFSLIRIFGFK